MKISYELNGTTSDFYCPENWEELTTEQYLESVKILLSGKSNISDHSLSVITSIPEDVIRLMSGFQKFSIVDRLGFLNNFSEISFRDWKIPNINIDGKTYYGPIPNFGNITWAEFVYADQCAINQWNQALVAALFRPQRDDYDGETDIRIPFSIFGTKNRFHIFDSFDPVMMTAILLNYRAMRRASLEDSYTEIFPYSSSSDEDGDDPNEDKQSGFSWTRIHRNLLGDRIQDEKKFLDLNCHTVLNRLNEVLRENRHNSRK